MSRRPVAVDIDGVLLDFCATLEACATDLLGRPIAPVSTIWSLDEHYAMTADEVARVLSVYPWHAVTPIKGAAEALERLATKREVVLVTGLHDEALVHRRAQLREMGFGRLPLYGAPPRVVAGVATHDKRDVFAQLAPEAVIDDQLNHLHAAAAIGAKPLWIVSTIDDPEGLAPESVPCLEKFARLSGAVDRLLGSNPLNSGGPRDAFA